MGEKTSVTVQDILYHYGHKIESLLGRCELLSLVAESIREEQPKIYRALTTISEDIRIEMESTSDEIDIFLRAAQHNDLAGSVDLSELAVLRAQARTEWAAAADRHKADNL